MHRLVVGLLSLTCFVLVASLAIAQDKDQAAEMQKYMELAQPGPHHKMMAERAGTWETHSKMWMQPGQDPMESKGTSTIESVLDGRFVEEVTLSPMMGMPWEGRGTFGYNNATKKHIGVWYDSFGTMMMWFEGSCENSCKTISLIGEYVDPISNENKKMKVVTKNKDDNHSTTYMYEIAADGTETKTGEIQYTRTSQAAR